jgi:pre-mRNA-processing factor 19
MVATAPFSPVLTLISVFVGAVFEKRLIEQYIQERGVEPGTDEELTLDDLIPVKSSRIVRPRPPTLTSIPALLATFQNEWDGLALQVFSLEQEIVKLRKELANALYQNDAAIRVIARLTKERDEARDALSKVTVTSAGVPNGDEMAVDSTEGLPEELGDKVDSTQKQYVLALQPSFLWLISSVDCPKVERSGQFRMAGPQPRIFLRSDPWAPMTCRCLKLLRLLSRVHTLQ